MKKVKYFVLLIILLALLIIPTFSKAANEQTYTDEEQGIEWVYQEDDSGNITNLKCNTKTISGKVTIPSKIDGKTVISLGNISYTGTFEECAGITEVIIPDTVTTIGSSTFYNCTGLKSVTLPNKLVTIGDRAFYNCAGLKSITIPEGVTTIGEAAFGNCTGLTSLKIPNSVTTIKSSAFDGCSGIKELTLSENLTSLNSKVFAECSGLTSVVIPESVTTIGGDGYFGAFYSCENLQKILIPDSVVTIGNAAFLNCDKLTIYGNDGMVSKQYAEEHEINFDYISNWDKQESGTDVTPPIVESMKIANESIKNYSKDDAKDMYLIPVGAKLTIKVKFSETIEGTTVPTLTIKFGDGANIELKEGTVGGNTITYTYTLKSTDEGVMSAVSFTGGTITDTAGNSATLSIKTITEEYGPYLINATGTKDNTNNTQDNDNNNNNSDVPNENNNQNTDDPTTATGKLPQTGVTMGIVVLIAVIFSVSIFVYFKLKKWKDIQ